MASLLVHLPANKSVVLTAKYYSNIASLPPDYVWSVCGVIVHAYCGQGAGGGEYILPFPCMLLMNSLACETFTCGCGTVGQYINMRDSWQVWRALKHTIFYIITTSHCSVLPCAENEFRCPEGGICFPNSFRCDNISDCIDGSDELDCPCENMTHCYC